MDDLELAELAMNSLRNRSLRSWLAILGIVIAVASIISLISITVGLNDNISKSLGGVGANLITISPGGAQAQRMGFGGGPQGGSPPGASTGASSASNEITFAEADTLRHVSGVKKIDAQVSGRATVSYRNRNTSLSVIGTEPYAFPESVGTAIYSGRTLGTSDTSSAVLGYSVAMETFNDSTILNKPIKINGQTFRVVGVLNQSGSSLSNSDRNVYITQKAAKNLFNQTGHASTLVAIAADGQDTETVAASLASSLRALHKVSEAKQDFTVSTAASLQSTISSVTDTLGLFLGGIAGISLIVGGIGVANAMFTSVLEQTRYIGLLKALGTRRKTIMKLFLYESCMVGLVGGAIGVILSFIGSALLTTFGLPSKITLDLVLLGLGFSLGMGAISGLIPARNAASVAPVEALRYE